MMPQNHRALELIETIPQLEWVVRSPDLPQVMAAINQVLLRSQRTAEYSLRRLRPNQRQETISRAADKLATDSLKDWLTGASDPLTNSDELLDHLSQFPIASLGNLPGGN
ncbi:MAG: hypothetical protein ACRC8S_21480 [Fimbriiglobus sp.]